MSHVQQAPALRCQVGRSVVVARALLAVAIAGQACVIAWLALGAGSMGLAGRLAVLAACGVCVGGALRQWRRMPQGWLLHQDGVWSLEPVEQVSGAGAPPGQAQVLEDLRMHLDLQHALLLSARLAGGGAGRRWLWLERGTDAVQWALLRCVVQAHRSRRLQRTIDTTPPTQGGA